MNRKQCFASAILIATMYAATARNADGASPVTPVVWVASFNGAVSFQPSGFQGGEGWVPAEVNHPLVAGDRIATVGKAEVHLRADSGLVTVHTDTTLLVQRLDDQAVLLKLEQGSLELKLDRYRPERPFSVATPNLSLEPIAAGDYQFETGPDGGTRTIKVEDGQCVAAWDSGKTFVIKAHQEAQIAGSMVSLTPPLPEAGPGQTAYIPSPAPLQRPDFTPAPDSSAIAGGQPRYGDGITPGDANRSAYVTAAQTNYGPGSPDEAPGVDDLANYGDWQRGPSGDMVWYPQVSTGWAPYTDGHWQWIDPWGWTWIDGASWGFAPFHYGRWATSARGWYWSPGPPVYSPALVAWVGVPGGANVAWFPLGPGESAGWASARYVNRSHVTAVTQTSFVQAASVARGRVQVPASFAFNGTVASYAPVRPERTSVLGTSGSAPHPSLNVMNRAAVTRISPGSSPMEFSRRQALWSQAPGQPLQSAQLRDAGLHAPTGFRVISSPSSAYRPAPYGAPARYGTNGLAPVQQRQALPAPYAPQARPGVPVQQQRSGFQPQPQAVRPQPAAQRTPPPQSSPAPQSHPAPHR